MLLFVLAAQGLAPIRRDKTDSIPLLYSLPLDSSNGPKAKNAYRKVARGAQQYKQGATAPRQINLFIG